MLLYHTTNWEWGNIRYLLADVICCLTYEYFHRELNWAFILFILMLKKLFANVIFFMNLFIFELIIIFFFCYFVENNW